MSQKRIILIHGRGTKPSKKDKKTLVVDSLIHGVNRVDSTVAQAIQDGDIKVNLAYYGDISNQILVDRKPSLKSELVEKNGVWSLSKKKYDKYVEAIADLHNISTSRMKRKGSFDKFIYHTLQERQKRNNLRKIGIRLVQKTRWEKPAMKSKTPDLAAYFFHGLTHGPEIRMSLKKELKPALLAGDDILLIAHSMGCIVSYDVLYEFSNPVNFPNLQGKSISQWMTLGNPLGDSGIRKYLLDAQSDEQDKYPRNIQEWINIRAKHDWIAGKVLSKRIGRGLRDIGQTQCAEIDNLYNFYQKEDTWPNTPYRECNPHKFYGYLDNPKPAAHIIRWANA